MNTPGTPGNGFDSFDGFVERKDALIGRDLVIRLLNGQGYRGPISDIVRDADDRLSFTLEWSATCGASAHPQMWTLDTDGPCTFLIELWTATSRTDEDGTIHIIAQHNWVGKILPSSSERLEKPLR